MEISEESIAEQKPHSKGLSAHQIAAANCEPPDSALSLHVQSTLVS